MPELRWEFQRLEDALRLCVRSEPAPSAVVAWTASSEDAGFVQATFESQTLAADDGVFVYDLRYPTTGYRAAFAEVAFGDGDARYTLSTNLRISDPSGRAPSPLTAIRGTRGVCPRKPHAAH